MESENMLPPCHLIQPILSYQIQLILYLEIIILTGGQSRVHAI